MYTQVEKSKENKSRAVANSVTQKKSNVKQGFGFVDNRPEALTQRKLVQTNVQSNQTTQLKAKAHMGGCGCSSCIQNMIQKKEKINQQSTRVQNIATTIQLKPCNKHQVENCAACKVANSNKNHNPNAGVSGGGGSAKANADQDAYSMANKDGKKSRKELNREFKQSQKKRW